jgi:hypothetical protein
MAAKAKEGFFFEKKKQKTFVYCAHAVISFGKRGAARNG